MVGRQRLFAKEAGMNVTEEEFPELVEVQMKGCKDEAFAEGGPLSIREGRPKLAGIELESAVGSEESNGWEDMP